MYSFKIRLLTDDVRRSRYSEFVPKRKPCPVCCRKSNCADHVTRLRLPTYSYDIHPMFINFVQRLRGSICTGCKRVYQKFSDVRRKAPRRVCRECKSTILTSAKEGAMSPDEHRLSITDSLNRVIRLSDLCIGSNMLSGPFMHTTPKNYMCKPLKLYCFIVRKRHSYSSVYTRIHKRESWLRNQIVSRRTRFSSRAVITPSSDYRHSTYIYIPRLVARNRGIKENDLILCNRHPTLHVESFVTLRCRIWDHATIGLNPCSTPSLSADYDGDQINLSPLNSYEERAQALCLMYPESTFITPPKNNNMLCVTQNMTYMFRLPENLNLLLKDRSGKVYFKCPSFEFREGTVTGHFGPITRSDLNNLMTHVYYQTGAENAVAIFNTMARLTHEVLLPRTRGVTLKDLLEFVDSGNTMRSPAERMLPREENLFAVQPRHGIKGDADTVSKILSDTSGKSYWAGEPTVREKFELAKIARSRLTDAVTLIADSGWNFKKLAVNLNDLTSTYLGNMSIEGSKSLTHDMEFYFNYLCRTSGIKDALRFALINELELSVSNGNISSV